MSDDALPVRELERIRDCAAIGECPECGGAIRLEGDGLRHWWHRKGCPFASRLFGDDDAPRAG